MASSLGLLVTVRSNKPLRIKTSVPPGSLPVLPSLQQRLVLRGDRDFLRNLRAAEMAAWEASGGDFTQSATDNQPAGGGFAGSKVTLAAAAAGNLSHELPVRNRD
jgi:hypothetical protein